MSLPTTVTINTEERDQNPFTNLRQILSFRGSQVTLRSILGQVSVGQRAGLALHGRDQTERARLSSKQWILGVTREGRSVSGASTAKVLPTKKGCLKGLGYLVQRRGREKSGLEPPLLPMAELRP